MAKNNFHTVRQKLDLYKKDTKALGEKVGP